jgi:glucose-1-phosphate thymidylyltransferase
LANREVVAVVPAAGRATRIAPLPFSKELYPIALHRTGSGAHPKVVSSFMFDYLRRAGIRKAYVVLREGKWDIPAYFASGAELLDMQLAYLVTRVPYGSPFSVDAAYPFVSEATVALGFADILLWPDDLYARTLARLEQRDADVALALVPCDRPHTSDMVEFAADGRVRRFVIKQREPTGLEYSWAAAVWTPAFTRFLHDYLEESLRSGEAQRGELFVGDVMQAAVDRGMHVDAEAFASGGYVDIGSPEMLERLHRGELTLP